MEMDKKTLTGVSYILLLAVLFAVFELGVILSNTADKPSSTLLWIAIGVVVALTSLLNGTVTYGMSCEKPPLGIGCMLMSFYFFNVLPLEVFVLPWLEGHWIGWPTMLLLVGGVMFISALLGEDSITDVHIRR